MLPSTNTSPDTVAPDCLKASVITRHPMLWPTRIVLRAAIRSFTRLTAAPIVPLAGGQLSSTAVPPTARIEASLLRLDRRHAAEDCHDIRHRISAESDKHLIRRLS